MNVLHSAKDPHPIVSWAFGLRIGERFCILWRASAFMDRTSRGRNCPFTIDFLPRLVTLAFPRSRRRPVAVADQVGRSANMLNLSAWGISVRCQSRGRRPQQPIGVAFAFVNSGTSAIPATSLMGTSGPSYRHSLEDLGGPGRPARIIVGARIKTRRKLLGMSQSVLAEGLGITARQRSTHSEVDPFSGAGACGEIDA